MEMREHGKFPDTTGPVADRTAVKNRWKLQAMAEIRLVRVKARHVVRPHFVSCPQIAQSMILSYQTKFCLHFRFGRRPAPPKYLRLENLLVLMLFILSATVCARH